MRRCAIGAGLAFALAAAGQELTEKAVNEAIDRGLHFLYSKQQRGGDWDDVRSNYAGGHSASKHTHHR